MRDGQNRIDYVKSAAEGLLGVGQHRLDFQYSSSKLNKIVDPIGRQWTFAYDGSGRLWKINYPMGGSVPASFVCQRAGEVYQ